MSKRRVLFVVDRIEGRGAKAVVVLVTDDDEQVEIPRAALGDLAVEGAVLRVPRSDDGFDWSAAERDVAEETRRTDEAAERLKRLSADDPGGDLEL